MSYLLTTEQAKVGIVAGMWTQEDIEKAKKSKDGHIKNEWYLLNEYGHKTRAD
jgi:hypothetical protein